MSDQNSTMPHRPPELQAFERNNFFYGKLMDVFQFNLDAHYANFKRCLLNRLVGGYGVICGLDVLTGAEPNKIVITPGVAIDKWGRELIVAQRRTETIPPEYLSAPPGQAAQGGGG